MSPSRIFQQVVRRFEGDTAGPAVAAGLALSYVLLVVAAVWPSAPLVAVFALAGYAAEAFVGRRAAYFSNALSQVGLGVALRAMVREAALLLLLVREDTLSAGWLAAVAATLVLLHVVRAVHSSLAVLVTERRKLPVITRGFDLGRLRLPAPPPFFVREHRGLVYLDAPVLAGALLTVAAGASWPVLTGMVLPLVAGPAAIAVTAWHVRLNRHLADREQVLHLVAEEVAAYAPEVVLYFSGADDCMYQINMWLETFDRLDRKKMIIMRERLNIPLLGRTSSPILCFPGGTEMMNFTMPSSTRVALFPANAGKNIHMLRLPDVGCVFIGHGDSDKAASFSPFSKVYDEVWVAGPAGRERYLRSDAGVRDDEIVEVGRPQLAPISVSGVTPDPMFTVLYAPTWEGWTGDRFHTSVATMGVKLVRTLLDHAPHVRLLYKPHPMAGKTDPAVRRAHQKIVKMIAEANAARDASGQWPADPAHDAAARARLSELTDRLSRLGRDSAGSQDEAEESRLAAQADVAGDALWRDTEAECAQAYWESEGFWRHRVVTGTLPHLYECFNRADVLITDISSVVADFIASGKPYVVTNGADLTEEDFRRVNPSASAAYLVGRDCAALPEILTAIGGTGPDPMAERRNALKHHLLGADSPDAMARFAQAVDALAAKRSREAVGEPA
ncbi:glycerophosphotransferase [Actinomadura sp. DC4]|uniref:glycerophosphotransferase n=1 Tax=Actinomadura sp. DC4 TaxID=3055069 RepID=UPI0025B0E3D7|nr:glycerophosphotransferase [Actinomadura sp. DC4]MDN3355488.1 glycerophosphotransferase [Actinomadura sp. DC4]